MNKKIIIKEQDMEHGTNILRLIYDAYSFESKKYGLTKIKDYIIEVKIPQNVSLPKNFLKKMEKDIENILNNKLPKNVLYPWIIEEYTKDQLRKILGLLKKDRIKIKLEK